MSNSLQPHGLQHTRLPCPSPTPGVYPDSCALSWWCRPTISSSVIPFSSCLQSFPASGSFPISQLFASDGQSIGASASASVLTMNIQDSFPLGLTGLVSLQSKGVSKSSPAPQLESINRLVLSILYGPLSYLHMTTGKTIALTIWTFIGKTMSLLFNMPSMFVLASIPRSKHLLISWLQSQWKWRKSKWSHSVTSNSLWPHGL